MPKELEDQLDTLAAPHLARIQEMPGVLSAERRGPGLFVRVERLPNEDSMNVHRLVWELERFRLFLVEGRDSEDWGEAVRG